jgi:hypothetical protein
MLLLSSCICSRLENCASCAIMSWFFAGSIGSWFLSWLTRSFMNASLPIAASFEVNDARLDGSEALVPVISMAMRCCWRAQA